MNLRSLLLLLTLCVAVPAPVPLLAHPGGRDSYGCHNDRKHGGYHCHVGPLAGQSFPSQADMLAASKGTSPGRTVPSTEATVTPAPTSSTGLGASDQVCIREHRTQKIMCGEPVR